MVNIVSQIWHLFLAVNCYSNVRGQRLTLTAQYSNALLPSGLMQSTSIFDGEDCIYFFGSYGIGHDNSRHDRVLKFNITADTIVEVASFGFNSCCGTVAKKDGLFYYFGGFGHWHAVKYDPKLNKLTQLTATIPNTMYSGSVQYPPASNKLIIFEARSSSDIGEIDLDTFEYKAVGTLPHEFSQVSAVLVGDCAILFGTLNDHRVVSHTRSLKVNLKTMESTVGPVGFNCIGDNSYAVYDTRGKFIYLVVGYGWDGTHAPTEGIYKIDPQTMANEFVYVENWPCKGASHFRYAPEQVYVEKLNRIYFFGGVKNFEFSKGTPSADSIYNFKIWYVELNSTSIVPTAMTTTMAPTISTDANTTLSSTYIAPVTTILEEMDSNRVKCNEGWNGSYPIPYYCSLYMICTEYREIPEFHQCPYPFKYNGGKRICDDSECLVSCKNKKDGKYPHPENFSTILVCKDGRELWTESCPLPTQYHPLEGKCVPLELLPFKIQKSQLDKPILGSEEKQKTRWGIWVIMLVLGLILLLALGFFIACKYYPHLFKSQSNFDYQVMYTN